MIFINQSRWKMLLELYWAFFRIGGLTFGGGLSMLPMLEYELVHKKKWLEEDELLDCYAIGQCTPGIIAVNTSTFVGYKKEKILGALFSTLGMITPSLFIITAIALCLENFMDNVWLQHALMGVRGVVCALMINTVINLGKKSFLSIQAWILAIIIFVLAYFVGIPTVFLVILAAMEGIALDAIERKIGKKSSESIGKMLEEDNDGKGDRS